MLKITIFGTLILMVIGGIFLWQKTQVKPTSSYISWEECTKMPGAVILESFPEKCSTPDGRYAIKQIELTIIPTPSEIPKKEIPENWKTFDSSVYNFTMRYPPNWAVSDNPWSSQVNFIYKRSSVSISPSQRAVDNKDSCFQGTQVVIYSLAGRLEACHRYGEDESEIWNIVKQKPENLDKNDSGFIIHASSKVRENGSLDDIIMMLESFSFN